MKSLLFIYSVASVGFFVHALPSFQTASSVPSLGESCDYQGYPGVVTETDDCPGAVSIWQYGPQASVQCCIVASCDTLGDSVFGVYTCLNIYKNNECGQGKGRFFQGHCLGDETVQCCVDGPLIAPSGYYNNKNIINQPVDSNQENYPTPEQHQEEIDQYWNTPNPNPGDSVVVPTVPTIDSGAIVVPTVEGPSTIPQSPESPPPVSPPPSVSPPRTNPIWHKKGWANDIASANVFDDGEDDSDIFGPDAAIANNDGSVAQVVANADDIFGSSSVFGTAVDTA